MPEANGQENKSKLFLKRKRYKKVEQEEKNYAKGAAARAVGGENPQ